ncbi:glycerophosphoryl diester phosphodiesterase membrane domain-containing protein [Aureibaculum sp. 2210JD6-5]|uniref:glycerophosphoryl diester phosphodiesterase membrane domain-containing protein n=1 Tax=Aureibaculum sp. 2210JD6-5 TaxID=3103957 RepID=UPI002AAD5646|nr:glycerophosphoryl diester phosphodiesterase membrane domain-containing protein [Aureibaculum sp. 2210JD6-5]MDY7395047.1 glycerophosphoryl diester phosphodiesterase membrane domain-containing protein [Aureibaculum sp. 2210JD6-5]
MFSSIDVNSSQPPSFDFFGSFFGWFFILMLAFVILYGVLSLTSLFFIKSYINNNGQVNFSEIRSNVFKKIWSFLGLAIIIGMASGIGMYLCLVPGIYLGVVFSLAAPIMIFENKSVGDTLSHSFKLIKDNWWNTFGCLIVVWLLIAILGQAFSIPAIIYYFIKLGTTIGQGGVENLGDIFDTTYIVLNVLSYLFQFMLYSIPLIAVVFIYYDLNEQKNLTGTIEKIDSLGQ